MQVTSWLIHSTSWLFVGYQLTFFLVTSWLICWLPVDFFGYQFFFYQSVWLPVDQEPTTVWRCSFFVEILHEYMHIQYILTIISALYGRKSFSLISTDACRYKTHLFLQHSADITSLFISTTVVDISGLSLTICLLFSDIFCVIYESRNKFICRLYRLEPLYPTWKHWKSVYISLYYNITMKCMVLYYAYSIEKRSVIDAEFNS